VLVGRYVVGSANKTGIRSMPMDCPVGSALAVCAGVSGTGGGGYTYGDLNTLWTQTQDVHTVGEIWAQTLWDLRTAVGSPLAESLITRAMELSPTYPSMLDMRNAILAADLADHSGNDLTTLWSVFAHRGLGFFASSQSGDDTAPIESFAVPPAAGSPTGTLSGTVTNTVGGAALSGVTIGISGHDSGFPGDYVATTDTDGQYTIANLVPGSYPSVYAAGGVDRVSQPTVIAVGANSLDWSVARDWSAASGGAQVSGFTGIDLSALKCGPANLIDSSATTGWASSIVDGTPYIIVKLPEAVDVTTFGVNPSNICGDGEELALRNYRLETSADGVTWRTASTGTFHLADLGRLNTVTPATSSRVATRWVRLTLLTPQGSGEVAVDAAELETYGTPSAGLPDRNHQGGHPPVPR
jgi:extracellular elastinolytic metalloproteinase